MQLYENNFPVQVQGADSGTSQFSIAMNAKAFRVLSDTLYQDKIGSLVREISTNAYDGHIMAGNVSEPFEIHLPDNFEPWFAVRDFGVGLSPESVRQVFTTYFMSTKDQSNDTVGAFGLGAKTPFAYTDQFTIESNYSGVKTIYSAFIDGKGIPNIAEMYSGETDERNGVEIKVAVKQEDFQSFRNAVANQLRFFQAKPLVKNCEYFQFAEVTKVNEQSIVGTDYVVTPFRSELIVIQGQIGYIVDRNKIATSKLAQSNPVVYQLMQSALSIKLTFKIGDIGVTASRENIEYDERTVANIVNKLEDITKDIKNNVDENLKKATCGWDKAILLSDMYSHFKASATLNYPNLKVDYRNNYYIDTDKSGYNFFSVSHRSYNNVYNRYPTKQVKPSKDTAILLVNVSRPRTEVMQKIFAKTSEVYTVFIEKKADVAKVKKELSAYLLGFDNFYLHSELIEKRVRQKSVIINPKTTFFEVYSADNFSRSYDQVLPDEFVYVEVNRSSLKNYGQDAALINEFNTLKKLDEFKDECSIKLLGIPVSEMKKLKDSGGVTLKEFMEDLKDNAPVSEIASKIRKARLYSAAAIAWTSCPEIFRQMAIESDSSYGKMLLSASKAVNKYADYHGKYNAVVANSFGIKATSDINERTQAKITVLKSKHPILEVNAWELRNIDSKKLKKLFEVTM